MKRSQPPKSTAKQNQQCQTNFWLLPSSSFSLAQTGSPGRNLTVEDPTALQMTPGCALALLQWKGALPTLSSYRTWERSSHEEQASHMGGNFINSLVLHSPKNQQFQILRKKMPLEANFELGIASTSVITTLQKLRQEDYHEFQVSLNHSEPWLKKTQRDDRQHVWIPKTKHKNMETWESWS